MILSLIPAAFASDQINPHCPRLLAPDAVIDGMTQLDPVWRKLLPQNQGICGPFCIMKAELYFRRELGQAIDLRPLLLEAIVNSPVAPETLFSRGIKVWEQRDWLSARINALGKLFGCDSDVSAYGSSFITGDAPSDLSLDTLESSNRADRIVMVTLHRWWNAKLTPAKARRAIETQVRDASLDPGDAEFRHWVLLRRVVRREVDGKSVIVAQLEDPDHPRLIQGELIPIEPKAYGFKTWRFLDPQHPKQLNILTGLLEASLDLDLEDEAD